MKLMNKRIISLLLALVLLCGIVPTAFASEINEVESPWNGRSAVFVGDSITAGVGTSKLYYQFLDEKLGFGSVTAMGVGGSCISAASDYGQNNQPLINRYQNIPSADLIVIFMGTNDYGHETPLGSASDTNEGTFYGALNTIIPALVSKHTSSKLVFVTSLHRYGAGTSKILGTKFTYDSIPNGVGATLGDYVDALKKVCANNGVSVIDLYAECTLDPSDADVRAEYMPDGIHPNAAGHELIAGIMESHIRGYEPVESEPVIRAEMIQGNKFAAGNNQPCRASSCANYYLTAGTVITLKDPAAMQWACAKTSGEYTSNNLGYFHEKQWTDIVTAVVAEDGWVGFTFKYRDETRSFDLSKPLSDYISIHTHTYTSTVTPPTCTEQGYTTYTCACGDSYVSDYVDATEENPQTEDELIQAAKNAYARYMEDRVDEEIVPEFYLYEVDGQFILLQAETIIGTYATQEEMLKAIFGNPKITSAYIENSIYQNSESNHSCLPLCEFASETMRNICKIAEFPLFEIDANIAIIGDSTISGYPKYSPIASYFKVTEGKKISDISKPGDTIVGQLSKWNTRISTADKDALDYVFVQIGLNDIDETVETFRTQYKSLIAQIRADAPNAMVILGTMVPCKQRWQVLYPNTWQEYQERWETANEDIKNGYYDCDRVAYLHTEALGFDGYLRTEYDHGDHIHENAEGGKIVACSWSLAVWKAGEEWGEHTHTYENGICTGCGEKEFSNSHQTENFRWEISNGKLTGITDANFSSNAATALGGSITNGVISSGRYQLAKPLSLLHDQPWAVEWRGSGDWTGMLLATTPDAYDAGLPYFFKTGTDSGLVAFGYKDTQVNNYGRSLKPLGLDYTQSHTYRLENRIHQDGSNMVYLLVDNVEIGPMNCFYIGGSNDQNQTVDWLSGKDFSMSALGTTSHPINGIKLEYLQMMVGDHSHSYEAVATAPTCTEQGYTTYTCNCGASYVDDHVEAVWHSNENGNCSMCGCAMARITRDDITPSVGTVSSLDGTVNTTITTGWYWDIPIPEGAKQIRYMTFKTAASWGSAFLNGSTYISGVCETIEGYKWVTMDIPEGATIFRHGYLSDARAEQNGRPQFQYVEFSNAKQDISQYMPRPATGCHSFSVNVNIAPAMGDPDGNIVGTDYGYIMLPTNYTSYGEPTRLIIVCHGAGGKRSTYQSNSWKIDQNTFWTDMGYAIMDMAACPKPLTTDDRAIHYGNPTVVDCYKAGFDYVMENFNLKQDGIYVIGTSMGGLSSFQIVQSGKFPVLAQVGFCPAIDLFKQAYCAKWGSAERDYQKSHISSYFGFEGAPASFTNTFPTDAEIELYKNNFEKTVKYSPILCNVVDGDITSIFNAIPTSATGIDATEAAIYAQLTATHPCPVMIIHSKDDSVVSYRYSQYFVDMLKRSGQAASLYTIDGVNHMAWQYGKNCTLQGLNGQITIKESQYEAYKFFEKFEKHEVHQPWVDPAVKATCSTTGLTEGKHCASCGEILVNQNVIPTTNEHTYENGICTLCGAAEPFESISLRYDDRLDFAGKTVEIVDAGVPTSWQVGYGVEENTVPDTAVVTLDGDTLIATGIGTAKVRIGGVLHEVTVTAAPISLLLIIGQSNAEGMVGRAQQSIACENGQVYSTYAEANGLTGDAGLTVDNAGNYVPSALTGAYSTINVNGTDSKLSNYPVNSLAEDGNGKYGMDSGIAYEWIQQTGEKVWVVNAAHGASSISSWQPGESNFEEAVALMDACQNVLRREIAAGHFTFSHMGYYWCQGCADETKSAQWYVERYVTMHEALKAETAFDADSNPATTDFAMEFGGIILVMAGHENAIGYRKGVYSDSSDSFFASFKELEMRGPRVAQIWMANNPALSDIHLVCTLAQDWVTMPDGNDGVAEYFESRYENGVIDYPTQVRQSESWYSPTTPADVKASIHYYQVGYNEVGRESARNTLYILGISEKPNVRATVSFVDWTGYRTVDSIRSSGIGNFDTLVVPLVSPCYESKNVTYTLSDGLSWNYYDLLDAGVDGGTLTASVDTQTVAVIGREYYSYRFELVDGKMVSVSNDTFRENMLTATALNTYTLETPILLKHDKGWIVEFNSVAADRFMALASSKGATDGMFYFFKSKSGSGVLSVGEYKDGLYQNYGLKQTQINIDWTQPHTYRFRNVINSDGTNTIHIYIDGEWRGTATNLIINDVLQSTDNMYLSGKDFAFVSIGCGGFGLGNNQMAYLEVLEDYHTHTYENGICTGCGEAESGYHIPGDINGDGSVNNKDFTRLFQYLADWDVEAVEAALDVNGDGSVNNKDLTRLFQYLSDWDVELK